MNKQIALAFATLVVSGAAAAQPYVAVSAGGSKVDVDCEGASTCDKSGTAFRLLGGYKFTPNLALEAGYMNFGKARFADTGLSLDLKADAFTVGGAYHADFASNWNFVARLGLASMNTKGFATVGAVSGSLSELNAQLYGGLGVGYKISKNMSLDLAMDVSKVEIEGEKSNVAAYTVGLTFGF